MEESLHQETPSKHSETPTEKDAPKIEYPSESNPSQIKMKQILFKKKKKLSYTQDGLSSYQVKAFTC